MSVRFASRNIIAETDGSETRGTPAGVKLLTDWAPSFVDLALISNNVRLVADNVRRRVANVLANLRRKPTSSAPQREMMSIRYT